MYNKICTVPLCNYPVGECGGGCWHPEEKQMALFDEDRADIIGQNGNDGLHYEPSSKVCVVIIENGKITLDYMSSWITGNGTEQLERAKKMIDMVIGKKQ
jgi:hypothetical protein